LKEKLKQLELFLKSSFDRGIRIGFGIAVPLAVLYLLGYLNMLQLLLFGFFKCARRHSGSIKRKVNAILVSIGLTMVITAIILFSKPFLPFIGGTCNYVCCVAAFCLWF
jgi:hypothetical protein